MSQHARSQGISDGSADACRSAMRKQISSSGESVHASEGQEGGAGRVSVMSFISYTHTLIVNMLTHPDMAVR